MYMTGAFETILKSGAADLFDNFTALFDVRIAFFDVNGREIRAGLNKGSASFCSLLRTRFDFSDRCRACDIEMRAAAAESGQTVHYHCPAGLVEAITPVILHGRLCGFVMIGQVRDRTRFPSDLFRGRTTAEKKTLSRRFAELPYIAPERMKSFLAVYGSLIDNMIAKHHIALAGNAALEGMLAYMEANAEKNPPLADVAAAAKKKPSTASHIFRSVLKASFRHTMNEMRIRKTEEYAAEHPRATIGEIAERFAFTDQFHFSKLYKKYRGKSPSKMLRHP
ncbi:MAG: PocR ligand-binding domain-containing protein [Spirochaetota bacterium]